MKERTLIRGTPLPGRSRWLKAAVFAAALVALCLLVTPVGVKRQVQPPAAIGKMIVPVQSAGQATLQPPIRKAENTTPKSGNKAVTKAASATGGMMAFIDPDTGQIREPEAAEVQSLIQMKEKSAKAKGVTRSINAMTTPVVINHPTGAVGMVVGEDQMSYSMARINPDGTLSTDCLPGKRAADNWLRTAPDRPSPARKEQLDEK